MRRFTMAVVWLATAFVLLGTGCGGKDDPAAPALTGGGGGGGGDDTGVAYELPLFHARRYGMHQYGSTSAVLGTVPVMPNYATVGERGIALVPGSGGMISLPTSTTVRLNDAWISATGVIYVVGDKTTSDTGLILRYQDGKRYRMRVSGLEGNVIAVHGTGEYAYFATSTGELYFYNAVDTRRSYETTGLMDVSISPSGIGYAAGPGGILTGSGLFWSPSLSEPGRTFTAISARAFDDVLAVSENEIWHFDGTDWSVAHTAVGRLADIDWVKPDFAAAVGPSGVTSTLIGTSWSDWVLPGYPDLKAVTVSDMVGDFALAVGDSGATYGNAANYWDGVKSPRTDWTDLMGTSGTTVYGIRDGRLMKHDTRWEEEGPAPPWPLDKLCTVADNDIWAVGKWDIDTFAMHYDGSAWTSSWLSSMEEARDIWATTGGYAFVASDYGTVFHSRPSWAMQVAVNPYQHLRGIWGAALDNVYTVGENGTVCHWDGLVWAPMVSGTAVHLNAIHGSASNNIVAVGESGVVLRYNGSDWIVLHSGTSFDFTMVWTDGPSNIWAASIDGNVVRYNGTTYDVMETGLPQLEHNAIWGTGGVINLRIACDDDFLLEYHGR